MVKLFNAASSIAVVSSVAAEFNCYINNGGCSHVCNSNSNTCECPPCWALADDGLNCGPASGEVSTTCSSNTMKMVINTCVLDAHDYTGAYVGDDKENNACKPVLSADGLTYELEHGLDECGMALELVRDEDGGDYLKYSNKMTIPPKLNDIIYVDQSVQWEFSCAYSTSYEISNDMAVNSASIQDNFSATGAFDLNLSFFETDEYATKQETPSFQVGKPINFGITFNGGQPLNDLVFVPGVCEVENLANEDESWKVWDSNFEEEVAGMCDGTPNPVQFQILESPNESKAFYGMTYQGFAFQSVTGSSGDQRLKCHVTVCHVDDCSSICKNGCFNDDLCSEQTTTDEN